MDCKEIEMIKRKYRKGIRIKLIKMVDDPRPVESGTLGTVDHVDDAGTIHMVWDNGRGLGLIPDVDIFEIVV